ncbi:MAG TPA: hypothetical protein DCR93_21810, partial [Cytophagales bacterium]|nr:hypothetical protein [Cytophagales bacterium]
MMKSLYQSLVQRGIQLHVEGDQLKISAPEGSMTPELLQQLKASKAELMAWIKKYQTKSAETTVTPIPQAVAAEQGYPVSAGQRRMWVLSQVPAVSASYHLPHQMPIREAIDQAKFRAALVA